MKKIYFLMSVIFLSCTASVMQKKFAAFNFVQQAEAAGEIGQNYAVSPGMNTLEDANAGPANTTSEIAEHNDRADIDKDSANKSNFEKQADGSLSLHIKQMLLSNAQLSGKVENVNVVAVDGQVTLEGTVNSEEERANIVHQVRNMAGIDSVDNKLEIVSK